MRCGRKVTGRRPLGDSREGETALPSMSLFFMSSRIFHPVLTSHLMWLLRAHEAFDGNAGRLGIAFSRSPQPSLWILPYLLPSESKDGPLWVSQSLDSPSPPIHPLRGYRSLLLKYRSSCINSLIRIIQWLPIGCRINSTLCMSCKAPKASHSPRVQHEQP